MTRIRCIGSLAAVTCLLVTWEAGSEAQGLRPITEAKTILAIYTEDWGLGPHGPPKLIVVAWDDGRIVWSDDRLMGGPPYRGAQIDRSRVTGLLSRLDEDGLFDIDALTGAEFGPDAQFTVIALTWGGKQLKMRSWHELVEERIRANVRKTGIVSKEKPRFRALQEESQDYLFYRFVWAELRARALSLIPTRGDRLDGEVIEESGDLSWQEKPRP